MDKSLHQQGSEIQQQPHIFFAGLQIFKRIFNWLTGFMSLTEEEQNEAGIYPGNQHD